MNICLNGFSGVDMYAYLPRRPEYARVRALHVRVIPQLQGKEPMMGSLLFESFQCQDPVQNFDIVVVANSEDGLPRVCVAYRFFGVQVHNPEQPGLLWDPHHMYKTWEPYPCTIQSYERHTMPNNIQWKSLA